LKRNLGCKGVGVLDFEINKPLGAKVPLRHHYLSEKRGVGIYATKRLQHQP
jgi:hypothetical protein